MQFCLQSVLPVMSRQRARLKDTSENDAEPSLEFCAEAAAFRVGDVCVSRHVRPDICELRNARRIPAITGNERACVWQANQGGTAG